MLKPTAATARSPQHAQKKKKQPSPRLTEAPVQSQAARDRGRLSTEGDRSEGGSGAHP